MRRAARLTVGAMPAKAARQWQQTSARRNSSSWRSSRPARGAIWPTGWRSSPRRTSAIRTRRSIGCVRKALPSRVRRGWSAFTVMAGGRSMRRRASARRAPRPRAEKAPPTAPPSPDPGEAAKLEKLMAQAKGYRPLYLMLEAEVKRAVPHLSLSPAPTHISLGAPAEFAAVALTSSEVRLGLALGEHAFDTRLQRAKLKGLGGHITHMIVLTDARQVNTDLISLVLTANARVNG